MRASTKRILSILLSGIFLIGIIVISSSLIQPEFNKAMEKRATLHSKTNLYQNQQNVVDEVQNLISEFQGFDELQEVVSLGMPTDEASTQMLAQITAIARNSAVSINSFESSPNPLQEKEQALVDRLGSLEVNLAVSGSYENVSNFVELLETNVRIFNVKEISMSPDGQSQGNNINANLVFNAYYQGQ